jgi:N-acetylgalactosamine-6-sulfatase
MVERMDRGVGAILKALEEEGEAHNTIVVFASDNGANRTGRNAPFSGYKGGTFEGGIRVPCIARWPGVLPAGGVADHACMTMDLTASFAEIAGATPAKNRAFDGIDILGKVKGGRRPAKRTLFWRARRGERAWRAVRDGSLKYISRTDGPKFQEYLFDLEFDPSEKNNLLKDRPADTQRLRSLLVEWEEEVHPRR